ncbi:MAG: cupredoxin domain-containing protein [Bryobacteraceae bacterium]
MFPRQSSARLATLLAATSLVLVACAGGTPSSSSIARPEGAEPPKRANVTSKVNTVLISQFKYQPDTLVVNVGDTVEWKNADIVPHTITAVDGKTFDSGGMAKGASWRFIVIKKGTYEYLCTLHPNMKAKLVVQ